MKIFPRLLLDSAPVEGNGPGDAPPAPAPTGAPPPAATAVVESGARESDATQLVEARRKLVESEDARKKVELRNMELEDQVRTLTTPPKATPTRRNPWTYFDDESPGAD